MLALEEECGALHRQIFGAELPAGMAEAYRRAHEIVFAVTPVAPQGAALITQAVSGGQDLEALELAWRGRDKDNPLTKKLNILFYLVECTPRGAELFVNAHDARLQAWLQLSTLTLRSLYKRLKGQWLLRRLDA